MKRRVWGQFHTIKGDDLTKVGEFYKEAIEGVGLGFGQGRLGSGFRVTPGSVSTAAKLTAGWAFLERADGVLSLVQVLDTEVDFSGYAAGTYDIVGTVVEAAETTETITPPPQTLPNGSTNPFYDARFSSYSLDVAVKQTLTLSIQTSPHTPAGAEVVIATVSWNGTSISQGDITEQVGLPAIGIADEAIHANHLNADTAGDGLVKNAVTGALDVNPDGVGIEVVGDAVQLKDGGVTDAKIGNRTVNDALAPTDDTGTLSDLLSELANRVLAITGKVNWYDDPRINLEGAAGKGVAETIGGAWTFTTLPTVPLTPTLDGHVTSKKYVDDTVNSGSTALTNHINATPLDHPDGSVTDAKIGDRTVVDTTVPLGDTGNLTWLVSSLANRIKAITGGTSWIDDPADTIANIRANAAFLAENETVTGAWTFSGTTSIDTLRITNPNDVTPSSTNHGFQVGPDTGNNIAIDGNEIMARYNGVVADLYINSEGGIVRIRGGVNVGSASPLVIGLEGFPVWHQGNDGAGSGLDADLLDGLDSSQFLRSDVNSVAVGQIVFALPDSASSTKMYWRSDGVSGHRMYARAFEGFAGFTPATPNGTLTSHDFLFDFANSRWVFDSTPYVGANEIIHAGNIGNYSSSNADFLDGIDSTQFLRSDVDDQFTGTLLTVNNTMTVGGTTAPTSGALAVDGGGIEVRSATATWRMYVGVGDVLMIEKV